MRVGWIAASVLLVSPAVVAGAEVLAAGLVTDLAGHPLKGVRVEVADRAGPDVPTAATDEDGLFRIEAPAGSALRFSRDGFLPREIAAPGGGDGEVVVRLVRACTVAVRLLDRDGAPVRGAAVSLLPGTGTKDADHGEGASEKQAKSSAAGVATIAGVAPGVYDVRVLADEFQQLRRTGLAVRGGVRTETTLRLWPAFRLIGRVLDEKERPIEGARVIPLRYKCRGDSNHPLVATDAKGRFRLSTEDTPGYGWPRAAVVLSPGRAPVLLPPRKEGERERRVDVRLGPPASLTGRVQDEDGNPVAGFPLGALVRFLRTGSETGEADGGESVVPLAWLRECAGTAEGVVTDAEGRFSIPDLPAGHLRLVSGQDGPPRPLWEDVALEEGEKRGGVVLTWAAGHTLAGTVEDPRGDPIAGATVEFYNRQKPAKTDDAGRFRLSGFRGESLESVTFRASGFGTKVLRHVPLDGDPLRVRLMPAGSIAGRVFAADTGEPVASFRVTLEPARVGEDVKGERADQVFSDPEGRFLLGEVTPGTYTVQVGSPEHVPTRVEGVEVRVGEERPLPPINLEPGREIHGVVTDTASGLPVPGAGVRAAVAGVKTLPWEQGFDEPGQAETDTEGRYRVAGLDGTEFLVRLEDRDHMRTTAVVRFDEGERSRALDVALGRGGTLEVTVVDRDGEPAQGVDVWLAWLGEPPDRGTTIGRTRGEAALWRRERLAPGPWKVSLQGGGTSREVEVLEGEITAITLRERGAVIAGRLLFRGVPLKLNAIALQTAPWKFLSGRGRGTQRFEIGPVQPGTYTLRLAGRWEDPSGEGPESSRTLSTREKVVVPEETDRVERDFVVPDRLYAGRVVEAESGKPIPGFRVVLSAVGSATEGAGPSSTSGLDGEFDITVREPGRYRVTTQASWSADRSGWHLAQPVEVTIPEEAGLTGQVLALTPTPALRVRVLDPEGHPLPGARAGFSLLSDLASGGHHLPFYAPTRHAPSDRSCTDAEGWCEPRIPGPGPGLVFASHRDFAPAWVTATVRDDRETELEVSLSRGGRLEVVPPYGWRNAPDHDLLLSAPGVPQPIRILTNWINNEYVLEMPDGSVVLPHLPAGTWTVEARGGKAPARGVVELEEGGTARLDLTGDDEE